MRKEEKKADLEQLLNTLVWRWWKPMGYKSIIGVEVDWDSINLLADGGCCPCFFWMRYLVSKESWLWQFVCENGMVKHEVYEDIQSWEHTTADHSDFWYTSWDNYEFYVIESSLKDESELEDFLLNSIKLD